MYVRYDNDTITDNHEKYIGRLLFSISRNITRKNIGVAEGNENEISDIPKIVLLNVEYVNVINLNKNIFIFFGSISD